MILSIAAGASPAFAQNGGRFELGGHVSTLNLSELDVTDVGVGLQFAGRLTPTLAVDGGLTWLTAAGSTSGSSFEDQQRVLGVVGLRAGLRHARVEIFGKASPGFLRFNSQDASVCILIFPAPLSCTLAAGYTALAFDFGGGASISLDRAGRTFVRIDAGDLMLRYGRDSLEGQEVVTDSFISHNFMINIGGGWRF